MKKDLRDLTGLDYIVRLGDDPQNAALLAIYLQVQCEKSGLHQVTLLAARDLLPKGQQAVQALMETLGQSGLETAFCTLDTQDPAMLKQISPPGVSCPWRRSTERTAPRCSRR